MNTAKKTFQVFCTCKRYNFKPPYWDQLKIMFQPNEKKVGKKEKALLNSKGCWYEGERGAFQALNRLHSLTVAPQAVPTKRSFVHFCRRFTLAHRPSDSSYPEKKAMAG